MTRTERPVVFCGVLRNFVAVKKCRPKIRKGAYFLVVIRCRLLTHKNHLLMLNWEILVENEIIDSVLIFL